MKENGKQPVTRPCPVCHDQKAAIRITETGNAQTGKTEKWEHVGKGHSKTYKTS